MTAIGIEKFHCLLLFCEGTENPDFYTAALQALEDKSKEWRAAKKAVPPVTSGKLHFGLRRSLAPGFLYS